MGLHLRLWLLITVFIGNERVRCPMGLFCKTTIARISSRVWMVSNQMGMGAKWLLLQLPVVPFQPWASQAFIQPSELLGWPPSSFPRFLQMKHPCVTCLNGFALPLFWLGKLIHLMLTKACTGAAHSCRPKGHVSKTTCGGSYETEVPGNRNRQ